MYDTPKKRSEFTKGLHDLFDLSTGRQYQVAICLAIPLYNIQRIVKSIC
jgi:hypothetical protein